MTVVWPAGEEPRSGGELWGAQRKEIVGKVRTMNRRDFFKAAAAGTAALAIPARSRALARQEAGQVLEGAGERIERYRMGRAVLRLVDPRGQAVRAGRSVRIEQVGHKFLFGCNIFKLGRCRRPEQNAAYGELFAGLLNYATLPFYWWHYERSKGQTNDALIEEMVRWCKEHGVTAKGHPLAWNWGEQDWLPDDPEEVMKLQMARIERCVRRFKGGIDIWDVVNEATGYDREEAKRRAPRLTEAIRRMGVGEYVRRAFRTARKANEDATLVINDYRTDAEYGRRVLRELVGRYDRPLYDAIGIQSHMHGRYWGAARTWDVCDRFAVYDRPLHFTETTIVSGPKTARGWVTTAEGEKAQAGYVTEFYTVLFSHPAVEAITWWDFTDQGAWRGAPAGLIRADMTPKPAYDQLKALIKGRWWTRTEAELGPAGRLSFRGFFGRYKVTVGKGEQKLTGKFNFDKDANLPIEVQLAQVRS